MSLKWMVMAGLATTALSSAAFAGDTYRCGEQICYDDQADETRRLNEQQLENPGAGADAVPPARDEDDYGDAGDAGGDPDDDGQGGPYDPEDGQPYGDDGEPPPGAYGPSDDDTYGDDPADDAYDDEYPPEDDDSDGDDPEDDEPYQPD